MSTRTRLRKFVLTAHVISSVGWIGAVAVFAALGVVGLTSQDAEVVRAVYLAMDSADWPVLIPLALASLLTGLIQSLGTKWGLFRHYWILVKLVINVVAIIILLLYTQTLSYLADVAAQTRSQRAEKPIPPDPRRSRPAAAARGRDDVGVQTAGYDPVRAAQATRAAQGVNRRAGPGTGAGTVSARNGARPAARAELGLGGRQPGLRALPQHLSSDIALRQTPTVEGSSR